MDESPSLHKPYLTAFGSFDLKDLVNLGRFCEPLLSRVYSIAHPDAINDQIRII
jgi:hypothetical protein